MSITGKLFANMLKRAGADSIMILDSPTPQLEGFFDVNVDNLKVYNKFLNLHPLVYEKNMKYEYLRPFEQLIYYNVSD